MLCSVCLFDGRRQEYLIDLKDGQIDDLRKDVEVWRHIAQEQYALLRREYKGAAIEGALDSLFASYRAEGRYSTVFCSQCGQAFPANYHGYSDCREHQNIGAKHA